MAEIKAVLEGLECRVGYATSVALFRELDDYVRANIKDNRYVGDVNKLIFYNHLIEYLVKIYSKVQDGNNPTIPR